MADIPDDGRALATVVIVSRDEYDLLDDFLTYHSAIFGAANVVVVDNGSTDMRLCPIVQRHRDLGVRFVQDRRPFCDAAAFMTEHMRALAPACRFLLPLETDEFVFSIEQTGSHEYGTDVARVREDVLAHLRGIPEEVSVLRYGAFVGSCVDPADAGFSGGAYTRPAAQMTRFRDQGWDKLIVRASAFVRMHVWCHHAVCSSGVEGKSSVLGLLHFHDTGSRRRLERAMPVVHAYRFVDFARSTPSEQLRVAAARHATGPTCGHKLGYLLEHLRRREAIKAFRRHLGRLPSSPGEMDRYAFAGGSSDPDAAVRRDLATGRLRRIRPPSSFEHGWDDLVFAEAAQEHQLSARQVANALASLDIVVECEGTAAV